MLSDFLNYDKIENGQLQLELTAIPFWRLLEQTTHEFKLSAAKTNIQLSLDLSDVLIPRDEENPVGFRLSEAVREDAANVKVIGDIVRLTLVLRNLLSNGIKFTPENGSLRLTASWCRTSNGEKSRPPKEFTLKNGQEVAYPEQGFVRVLVKDSGAGMTSQQLQMLFRDGVQFNPNELQAGAGSGLGLYIAKGIVEQHGGCLSASSEGLGKGTTFRLTLPLHLVPLECHSDASTSSNDLAENPIEDVPEKKTMRVLVVDDVSSNRRLLGRLLKNRGHTVDEADDGVVAVEMLANSVRQGTPYDTVLMDYEMPRMNGPEAAKRIRQDGSNVFLVGVTGNLLPEDIRHFRSCGADAVLGKPFSMIELEELWSEQRRHRK